MYQKIMKNVCLVKCFSRCQSGFRKGYNTQYCLFLLLTKLHTYGFSLSAFKSIHSYLKNRKERTKIDSTYGSWEEILFGVS